MVGLACALAMDLALSELEGGLGKSVSSFHDLTVMSINIKFVK